MRNFCQGVRNLSVEDLDGDSTDNDDVVRFSVKPEFARKGGGGLHAPENTLVAIREVKCKKLTHTNHQPNISSPFLDFFFKVVANNSDQFDIPLF